MMEKKSLNFLTQFYNHLGLLEGLDLFHFEKILISESGTRRSSNWANFWQISWRMQVN